jgi:tetratricopeptide (TPR) repeat protein
VIAALDANNLESMKSEDWYRKRTWTQADQEDFFARLKRSRAYNRAQYLRIQAAYLQDESSEEMIRYSLSLLDKMLAEYPEASEIAQAYVQKAECLLALNRIDEAIGYFRKALDAERKNPNYRTTAWLGFGWAVIEHELESLYDEVLAVLEEFRSSFLFEKDKYQLNAIRAVIADARGEHTEAKIYSKEALDAASKDNSGLRYHPKVGLVEDTNTSVHTKLNDLVGV